MQRSGFFDAHLQGDEYDRTYLAEFFALYFGSLVGNGVFAGASTVLQVSAADGMTLSVASGLAWINGYIYQNTSGYSLTVPTASGLYPRKDRVVVQWKNAEREVALAYKTGTPSASPQPPELERSDDYWELCLAEVYVPTGATSIQNENITDKRQDSSVCGWVTGLIQQIDTTNLFQQFTDAFNNWFNYEKGILDEDVAQNLLEMINNRDDVVGVVIAPADWVGSSFPYTCTKTVSSELVDHPLASLDSEDLTTVNGIKAARKAFALIYDFEVNGTTVTFKALSKPQASIPLMIKGLA